MRKQRLVALRIGISRRSLALLGIRGRLRPHTDILADLLFDSGTGEAFDDIENRLDGALRHAQAVRLPATVVVADDLVRFFMVMPPHNATGLQDCKAAAAMRFSALYGEPAGAWRLAADWNVDKPFLACALPGKLLDAILRVADTHRLTLVEVVPHFVATWNTWSTALKPGAWFCILHDDTLTLGATAHGQLVSVRTSALPAYEQHGFAWLEQHVAREALRLGIDAPSLIQLCGNASEYWAAPTEGRLACERLGAISSGKGTSAFAASVALASAVEQQ